MNSSSNNYERLLASLIRRVREKSYKTAREFYNSCSNLGISYSFYSAIETGKKMADIDVVLKISSLLGIDERTACHLWAKDQMPNSRTRGYFEPTPGAEQKGDPIYEDMNIDDYYVLHETQIKNFRNTPYLWDLVSLISAFSNSSPVTVESAAKLLNVAEEKVAVEIEWLKSERFVYESDGKLRRTHPFIHIPNRKEFKEFRDSNFLRASQDLVNKMSQEYLIDKTGCRVTFMKSASAEQARMIVKKIESLLGYYGSLNEAGQDLYALTICFGKRFESE